jgi:membrane-associated protease RseP (regulator of RpoE activity)
MDIQVIAAIVFVVAIAILLIIGRKNLKLEKILFPLFYLVLYRTKLGLKSMDQKAGKYREILKILGYCFIGIAFIGMIFMTITIIVNVIGLIVKPATTQSGVALVLPFTNIPGIGYLPFIEWFLAIFILAIVHEYAHGVMARAHDVPVKSSGFAFFSIGIPLIPAAFVEPDEKKLKKQPDIVQYSVFAAGPVANLILALLIFLLMSFVITPIETKITEPVGFSFELTNSTLPAAQAGLEKGMIITSFNGNPVKDGNSFSEYMYYCSKQDETVYLGTDNNTYEIQSANVDGRNVIGVSNLQNEIRVKEKFKFWEGTFFWIKSFLKWLGLFNLFIGLANLLPLGIVDGGRILQIALNKMTDKKKAKKIFMIITLFLLFALVFALIVQYFGNPFAFFFR